MSCSSDFCPPSRRTEPPPDITWLSANHLLTLQFLTCLWTVQQQHWAVDNSSTNPTWLTFNATANQMLLLAQFKITKLCWVVCIDMVALFVRDPLRVDFFPLQNQPQLLNQCNRVISVSVQLRMYKGVSREEVGCSLADPWVTLDRVSPY